MAVEKQAFRCEVSFNRNWGFSMPGSRWQKTNPRDYDSEMRQVPLDPTGTTAWTHPASLLDHVLSAMKQESYAIDKIAYTHMYVSGIQFQYESPIGFHIVTWFEIITRSNEEYFFLLTFLPFYCTRRVMHGLEEFHF